MHSKNKKAMTSKEHDHVSKVKELECSVCDIPGPSEAHEIKQGQWYTSVALCPDCHRGSRNGLHGQRIMWNLKKMDEIDSLAITIQRLLN